MSRKEFLLLFLGLVVSFNVLYGAFWVAKNVSYALFYQEMVQQTVRDMVKDSALKETVP